MEVALSQEVVRRSEGRGWEETWVRRSRGPRRALWGAQREEGERSSEEGGLQLSWVTSVWGALSEDDERSPEVGEWEEPWKRRVRGAISEESQGSPEGGSCWVLSDDAVRSFERGGQEPLRQVGGAPSEEREGSEISWINEWMNNNFLNFQI